MNLNLLKAGILYPDGDINKDKINLISGVLTQPFFESLWTVSSGDNAVMYDLFSLFVKVLEKKDDAIAALLLQTMYGLAGLNFPRELVDIIQHPDALNYYPGQIPGYHEPLLHRKGT